MKKAIITVAVILTGYYIYHGKLEKAPEPCKHGYMPDRYLFQDSTGTYTVRHECHDKRTEITLTQK